MHIEAWRQAFARYDIALTYGELHQQMGKGGDQLIPVFCSKQQVAEFGTQLEKLRGEIFARDYLPQVRPFPKVRELFERLRDDRFQIALATSSKEEELATYLKKLGVDDLISMATSADDAEHSKPCPDIFEAARAGLEDASAAEVLVVGDTPYAAIAAGRAGMRTIGVMSGGFFGRGLARRGRDRSLRRCRGAAGALRNASAPPV